MDMHDFNETRTIPANTQTFGRKVPLATVSRDCTPRMTLADGTFPAAHEFIVSVSTTIGDSEMEPRMLATLGRSGALELAASLEWAAQQLRDMAQSC